MATTRFKGETAGERLDLSGISDNDMIQLRHMPGTIEDVDKGISKSQLLSCPFGVSDTSASTGAKVASLTDSNPDFTLVSGREVVVCFTTANSASNPTLNFAGSGAIPIYYPNGQTVGAWPAETWMHLKYFYATVGNSTIQRWILLSDLPVNTVAANNMHSVTSNAVSHALSNSANELFTGAYWINNKPIYKRTISVIMNNEQTSIDVRSLSISMVCKIEAVFVHKTWANWIIPIPTIISQNSNIGVVYDNGDLIVLVYNNTSTNTYTGTAHITIYYTKTTD